MYANTSVAAGMKGASKAMGAMNKVSETLINDHLHSLKDFMFYHFKNVR